MKYIIFVLAVILALGLTSQIPEENDVLVLTDENFQSAIDSNEFILVEFYAPWCGHCKKLTPEYERAAKVLKAQEKPVPLAKLDATVHKTASSKFQIQGFPTLKFFNNGNAIDYNGGRVEKDIIAWINKRTGDVSQAVSTVEDLDQFVKVNPLAIVYFTEATSGNEWDTFKAVAMNFDKIAFAHCTVESVAQAKESGLGKLVLFKNFDEGRNDYEGEFTAAAINAWVDVRKVATVMDFDDSAIEYVFQKQKPTLFLFHNSNEESVAARKVFEEVAQELKTVEGSVKFCHIEPSNQHWQRLADYIGVNTAKAPQSMLVRSGQDMEKFMFNQQFTAEGIKQFLSDFENNKLSQHVKSEPVPETQDKPVRTIVGLNFEDEVINNNKDVLVKFYAPWCGHCKKLIPAWNEVAEKLQKVNPNIVIADCDSTANEISSVTVKGFPTIKFWAGNDKSKAVDFNGDRSTEGILTWLKDHTTHQWVDLDGAAPQQDQQQQQTEEKRDDL